MNRLPSYDSRTRNAERRLFLGLGLAALSLVAISAADATRFSASRQDIIAALCQPAMAVTPIAARDATTNLTVLHSGRPGESSRLEVIVRPKS